MTMSLWVWSFYHIVTLISQFFLSKESEISERNKDVKSKSSANSGIIAISWMVGGAMLWTGHTGWFLWTNMAIIMTALLSGAVMMGKPSKDGDSELAGKIVWSSATRLGFVITCWLLEF